MADLFHSQTYTLHPDYRHLEPLVQSLTERFEQGEGTVIHQGRNTLRRIEYGGQSYVVKSFHRPSIVNRLAYGIIRGSKAKRSYLYAERFLNIGVGTPQPVAWMDERSGILLSHSYYISCPSVCPHLYSDLFTQEISYADQVSREVGRVTAILHEHGYAHKDYGRGNILFGKLADDSIRIEIVDLNRMYIGKVNMEMGCKNLERLPATPHMHRLMAEEYAKIRHFDVEECYKLMQAYRSTQCTPVDPY